jgi:hypothetical protein
MSKKIIVLTPIKNEEWILAHFLKLTSLFADHIILLDQLSTDKSKIIAEQFKKVIWFVNPVDGFNEAERQLFLLKKARELFGLGNILLALDADEIIAANSINLTDWNVIKDLPNKTVLFFEKPDLFEDPYHCIRYDSNYPLGFIDDGSEHQPLSIHSIRIPQPKDAHIYKSQAIKFLHFGLANVERQVAKVRYYSVMEAINKTKSVLQRRECYNPAVDFSKRRQYHEIKTTPSEWLTHFTTDDLLKLCNNQEELWYNAAILKMLEKYGSKKFWADNIWDIDWEAEKLKYSFEKISIKYPPLIFNLFFDIVLSAKILVKKIYR